MHELGVVFHIIDMLPETSGMSIVSLVTIE